MSASKIRLGAAVAVGLWLSGASTLQASPDVKGMFMLNPGYSLAQEPFADSKTHAAVLGVTLRDSLTVGVHQTVNYAGVADAEQIWDREKFWNGRTSGFANIDLTKRDNRFVPFIGAFAGIAYDDQDAEAVLGPQLGFRQFLTSDTFLRMQYRYEWTVDEIEQHDFAGTADQGDHILSLGLGVSF